MPRKQDCEFERAFRGLHSTIHSKFWVFGDCRIETCSGISSSGILSTGCGKSLIFQLVPKVCSYLHDGGFSYPKAAIVVVICPLNALIDSHILELKENPKTVNTRNNFE